MVIGAIGEILMRLTPEDDKRLSASDKLKIYYGGGEFNTLSYLASFGHKTCLLTVLPDNSLGETVKKYIHSYNIDSKHIKMKGEKLGLYYALPGSEIMPTEVIYDRLYSSFSQVIYTDKEIIDFLKGLDILYVSGITAALSPQMASQILRIIKKAKELKIIISYDSNYRSKLWSSEEAGSFLKEVLPLVDIAILGILDIKYLLKHETDDLQSAYQWLKEKYPKIKLIASTTRTIINPNYHQLQSNIYTDKLYKSDINNINIIDRIGAGDAFSAGVIEGYLHKETPKKIADFALANATLKHYEYGDNYLTSKKRVDDFVKGNNLKINR